MTFKSAAILRVKQIFNFGHLQKPSFEKSGLLNYLDKIFVICEQL